MKMRGLLTAAIVLAALSGVLYWSNHRKPPVIVTKASADIPPKILSLNQADITQVDIKKKGGEELTLAKDDAGKWQIRAPKPFSADQDAVTSLLSTLSSLNSDRLIEEKGADLSQYGLAPTAFELDVHEKDNKTQKLLIGDDTPTGSAAYAALAGDPRLFTLASYNKSSLDKGVNDLRDKRLLTFDSDKLSRVELIAKKQDIEFGRNRDQWEIVKPKPLRADDFQVEELVRKLKDTKMDLTGTAEDAKKAAASFNSGTLVATAKVTDASGTQQLQVRKNKDDYYAKSSIVEGVYKIPNDLGQGLDKGLEDFRNKKLFDFGFTDPEKIEIHDGAKTYSLARSSEDWWANGTKMDSTSVQSLIEKIRDLSASKFVDFGFTASMLDLSITSNSGKRFEKVLISKSGDKFIAKRENEQGLYELDSTAVSDLQKAATDLKPVPPPAPQSPPKSKK